MQVIVYKTKKVLAGDDLFKILEESLPSDIPDKSVVAVTSKIIALCENRVAPDEGDNRDTLMEEESQYFLPRHSHKYDFAISIKNNLFVASGGIDRSNANGMLVLWPKDSQESANKIREYLVQKYPTTGSGKKQIGVVVTDSRTSPLRWGVTGFAIAHSGFSMLKSYVGVPDVFGRPLQFEKTNIADSLAAAAVLVMGEGPEQTPLAVVSDIPFVEFVDRNPTDEEMQSAKIALEDDVYYPLLTAVKWEKGKGK